VRCFQETTGASAATATRLLRLCKGDVDGAVARYFDEGGDGEVVVKEEHQMVGLASAEGHARESVDVDDAATAGHGSPNLGSPPRGGGHAHGLSWFDLPNELVAAMLSKLPAIWLGTASAACKRLRALIPEASETRARRLRLRLSGGAEENLQVGNGELVETREGTLAFLSAPSRAWTPLWPLRVIEALALAEEGGLWRPEEWRPGGGQETARDGPEGTAAPTATSHSGVQRERRAANEPLERNELLQLDRTSLVAAIIRQRARTIIRTRLIADEPAICTAMAEVGALGVRPDLCKPAHVELPSIKWESGRTVGYAEKPQAYDMFFGLDE